MLIQKDLEAKIITELTTVIASTSYAERCRIVGSWQNANDGLAKWLGAESDKDACLSVSTGNPSHLASASSDTSIAANVTLFVRIDRDPTGVMMQALASAIQDALSSWNAETYQQTANRFDLPTLAVDNVQILAGDSPSIVGRCVSVSWPVTFSASFRQAQSTSNSSNSNQ